MFPKFIYFLATFALFAAPGFGATCGDNASGFSEWKRDFAPSAQRAGVGARGLEALSGTQYASRTISADRNQRSFKLSLNDFMAKRGADAIVAEGKRRKAQYPDFYASLERAYGVPSGVILAIHGMETGFGRFMGNANVVSAVATLAYDCRRPEFFTPHLVAALVLVDRGTISPGSVGAMHGELGHTQFLPANVLQYGVDGDGSGQVDMNNITDALASTGNFLRQKGWQPGVGYQPGQPNFRVLQEWNAASVYQQAIAIIAARIDA